MFSSGAVAFQPSLSLLFSSFLFFHPDHCICLAPSIPSPLVVAFTIQPPPTLSFFLSLVFRLSPSQAHALPLIYQGFSEGGAEGTPW